MPVIQALRTKLADREHAMPTSPLATPGRDQLTSSTKGDRCRDEGHQRCSAGRGPYRVKGGIGIRVGASGGVGGGARVTWTEDPFGAETPLSGC